ALAGKLASRRARPLSAFVAAGPCPCERPARDTADRYAPPGDAARHLAAVVGCHCAAARARRTVVGVPEPARLCACSALCIVRVGQPLPALYGLYRAAPHCRARPSPALPSLRLPGV